MVTIYAQDNRTGVAENELVEVQVPVRPADNPNEGYWAEAKELVSSPILRIRYFASSAMILDRAVATRPCEDRRCVPYFLCAERAPNLAAPGPARVYTMRGIHRQILLRVSEANEDIYATGNVVIKRDLSVDVVVEHVRL